MIKNIELILSYLVIASALQFAVMISIATNFSFSPQQMAAPGMVIAFVTSCSLTIVKLKDLTASRKIYAMSALSNALTLSFATALSLQDPTNVGKVITTLLMAVISLLSILGWFKFKTSNTQQSIRVNQLAK